MDNLDDEFLDDLSPCSASAHVNSRENSAIAGPSDLDHPINKAIAEEPAKASKKKVALVNENVTSGLAGRFS